MAPPSSYFLSNIFSVKGHVVLVTGGGTGIGLYIAQGLAANGAKVYIGARRKEVVEKEAAAFQGEHGGSLVALSLDVTNLESIKNAVKFIEEQEGKLDALVNNAGIMGIRRTFFADPSSPEYQNPFKLGEEMFKIDSLSEWESVLESDTTSVYFVTMAFLELLQKGSKARADFSSSVINITSCVAFNKFSNGFIPYGVAKAGANHLTKVLAADLAHRNIRVRVNAIAPGPFPSQITQPGMSGSVMTKEEVNNISGTLLPMPADRAGKEEEIAGTALYLIAPAGYYTNGQIISVDGGYSLANIVTN